MSTIDLWARFLDHEKLSPKRLDDKQHIFWLIELCEILAEKSSPKYRPYKDRLLTRDLICRTAIENGMDLTKFKHHGKLAMGRGLLDAWNKVYREIFGSTFGTVTEREVMRRDVKTRLSKEKRNEMVVIESVTVDCNSVRSAVSVLSVLPVPDTDNSDPTITAKSVLAATIQDQQSSDSDTDS